MNAIVLAAGRGTRMRSRLPKVLHPIAGRTMLGHVLATLRHAFDATTVVVADSDVAPQLEFQIDDAVAVQRLPLGTADAVATGLDELAACTGSVIVLNGDVPLIRPSSLLSLARSRAASSATISIGTFEAPAGTSYGRIRRRKGEIVGVVEARDDVADRSADYEANGGIYCIDLEWLRANIGRVPVSASGEYYITSLIAMAAHDKSSCGIETITMDPAELLGVDDRIRLAEAEKLLNERLLRGHMRDGVTIVDPDRTVIEADVQLGQDVRIEPGCFLRGKTEVGEGTVVGPYSIIDNSRIGDHCAVVQSWLDGATVSDRVHVGPFSRLRPGTVVEDDVFIGNFVETKASMIGADSAIHHVSYIGDATLGTNVNIGAGTITCNFDGIAKHRTIIGNDVFVGCDTMLVAPVELGANSRTGAGAVVTRSVPAGQTVVGVPAKKLNGRIRPNSQENHGR